MQIAMVSMSPTVARARATVRSAFNVDPTCIVQVLDLDGSYVPLGAEQVLTPLDVGIDTRELHLRAMLLDPDGLVRWVQPALLRHGLLTTPTVLSVGAGVLLLGDPCELTVIAAEHRACLLARSAQAIRADGTWPGPVDLLKHGSYSPQLIAVSREAIAFVSEWEQLAADPRTASDRWLDAAASHLPHRTAHAARFLVSAWTGASTRISHGPAGTLQGEGERDKSEQAAGGKGRIEWGSARR